MNEDRLALLKREIEEHLGTASLALMGVEERLREVEALLGTEPYGRLRQARFAGDLARTAATSVDNVSRQVRDSV